ncbi:MAG: ornithine cyclodeaminase [Anaerolineae bacterium]|nr:ornithine cyclodeaminase [Anaerolineae bacterium]
MRILSGDDVRAALSMREAIEAVRAGFIALSSERATVPLRHALDQPDGVTLVMPAAMQDAPISTTKVVSVFPGNPARGLPTIHAAVLVTDAATGETLALLEGASLTALRTGAASGLATDLLAQPNARVLGVIGAGAQARTQIAAVCAVRPIEAIRVYSLSGAEALAAELRQQYDAEITVASSGHAALHGADVIVTATNSRTPVVGAADVSPGAHINGIGSFKPDMQEIAPDVLARAKIVVDHRASAWAEAGDLVLARDQGVISEQDVYAEIGQVAAGTLPGRTRADAITVFKSVGNAVQDLVVAARIIEAAADRDMGTVIDL